MAAGLSGRVSKGPAGLTPPPDLAAQVAALNGTLAWVCVELTTCARYPLIADSISGGQLTVDSVTADNIATGSVTSDSIQAGSIATEHIAANTITADDIATGAITADEIAAGSITATKILAGAVTADKISAGTIVASHIAANTITAQKIAAGTITALEISAGTITSVQIQAGAINADRLYAGTIQTNRIQAENIAANVITAAEIAASTITATQIAASTITSTQIAASTIVAADIAASTITTTQIAADTILAGDIAAGAITSSELAAGSITAADMLANTITAGQIAAGTITAAQIAAGSITADRIEAGSITATQIAAGTITATQIAAGTITGNLLAAGTITGDRLVAGAITADLLTVTTLSAISTNMGSLTAGTITGGTITGGIIRSAASGQRWQGDSVGFRGFNAAGTVTFAWDNATGKITSLAGLGGGNLVSDSSIESGLVASFWQNSTGASGLIASTLWAHHGTRSLRWTVITSGADSRVRQVDSRKMPVEQETHVGSCWVYHENPAARTMHVVIIYRDVNTVATTVTGPAFTVQPSTPTRLTYQTTPPATATTAQIAVMVPAAAAVAGEMFFADGFQYEPGSLVTAYAPRPDEYLPDSISGGSIGAESPIVSGTIIGGDLLADTVTAREVAASTITAVQIAANTITAGQVAAGTITAAELGVGSVTASELAAGAVTAASILAGTITATQIAATTITAALIAADTITATEIAAGTITASELAAASVTAASILANTITAAQIAAGTITATEIAATTITAAQIAAGAITATQIAAGAITGEKISATAIDGKTITGATILTGAVVTTSLRMDSNGLTLPVDPSALWSLPVAQVDWALTNKKVARIATSVSGTQSILRIEAAKPYASTDTSRILITAREFVAGDAFPQSNTTGRASVSASSTSGQGLASISADGSTGANSGGSFYLNGTESVIYRGVNYFYVRPDSFSLNNRVVFGSGDWGTDANFTESRIVSDTNAYKGLMIAGNRSKNNGFRNVFVYDTLTVTQRLIINDTTSHYMHEYWGYTYVGGNSQSPWRIGPGISIATLLGHEVYGGAWGRGELHCWGSANASAFNVGSDANIKDQVAAVATRPGRSALDVLNDLNPIRFTYANADMANARARGRRRSRRASAANALRTHSKDRQLEAQLAQGDAADDPFTFGFSAQEVEALIPSAVTVAANPNGASHDPTDPESSGIKAIDYTQITVVTVRALQQLTARVDELSAKVALLSGI